MAGSRRNDHLVLRDEMTPADDRQGALAAFREAHDVILVLALLAVLCRRRRHHGYATHSGKLVVLCTGVVEA